MGVATTQTQLPLDDFQQGIVVGRQVAERAMRHVAAWAEENPGQMLLVGLGLGFILGKLLLRKRRPQVALDDLDF